ncbi:MAG: DUF4836 family protein [Bacteroidaceae bacterium]|nr:DUF4836 family protein [Bacteroidaceae bacterium]
MKKFGIRLLVVLMVVSLCSCSKTDYQNVIPANATLVAKVDVRNIAEKGDVANSKAVDLLKAYLTLVVNGKDMKQAKAYIDDPVAMGFDFSMPVYLFMVGNEQAGLTLKVADEDAVKDFLMLLHKQRLASKPVEKHELMCGMLLDEISYSYDGKTFLLLASLGESRASRLEQMAQQLMNQTEDDSFVSTDAFDRLEGESDKDVVLYSTLAALPKALSKEVTPFLPTTVKLSDIDMVATLQFGPGKMDLNAQLKGSPMAQTLVFDEAEKNLFGMAGEYLDKLSGDAVLWMGTCVKGEWLLEQLKKYPKWKELLFLMERGIDIEWMLKEIDGDVAIEIRNVGQDTEAGMADFDAYAQVKDTPFLVDVDDWKQNMKEYGMTMQEVGKNQYVLNAEGHTIAWGVEDNNLYFTTRISPSFARTHALKGYEGDIADSKVFVYVDMTKLQLDKAAKKQGQSWLSNGLGAMKTLILKMPSAQQLKLTVEMENEDENFLKQLF